MEKGLKQIRKPTNAKGPFSLFSFPFSRKAAFSFALASAALLTFAPAALGQSCSMCYDSAAQQGPEAARALNTAIVVLLLPSVLLFGGVLVTALRRREE